LVTARQAAEEEGVTRKRLATKQCQGSVSYGVGSQAIYREACSSSQLVSGYREWSQERKLDRSRMEPTELVVVELRYSVVTVCDRINPIVNPIPRLRSLNP
jgi:hypothetical protein